MLASLGAFTSTDLGVKRSCRILRAQARRTGAPAPPSPLAPTREMVSRRVTQPERIIVQASLVPEQPLRYLFRKPLDMDPGAMEDFGLEDDVSQLLGAMRIADSPDANPPAPPTCDVPKLRECLGDKALLRYTIDAFEVPVRVCCDIRLMLCHTLDEAGFAVLCVRLTARLRLLAIRALRHGLPIAFTRVLSECAL